MYTIAKTFRFSASHASLHLPDPSDPCRRVHGHNYEVTLVLQRPLLNVDTGMLLNYRELEPFKRLLDERYDHRHLNDVLGEDGWGTTVENLAAHFYDLACRFPWGKALVGVKVSEGPTTWAVYSPEGTWNG